MKPGDKAYIIESNHKIREVEVVKVRGDFCVLRFTDADGGLQLRKSRVYESIKDAEAAIPKPKYKSAWN